MSAFISFPDAVSASTRACQPPGAITIARVEAARTPTSFSHSLRSVKSASTEWQPTTSSRITADGWKRVRPKASAGTASRALRSSAQSVAPNAR